MRITKKLMIAFTFIVTSVFLIACADDPANDTSLADTLSSLNLSYVSGDTAVNVTGNLTLPTSVGGVTITWVSSNTAVISNTGVVTRPAIGQPDANVTLTATLTYGGLTETKAFPLVVKALTLSNQELAADASYDMVVNAAKIYALSESITTFTMYDLVTGSYISENPFDLIYGTVTIESSDISMVVSGNIVTITCTDAAFIAATLDLTIDGFVVGD